jgi:ribose transport system permease protein
MSTPDTRHLTPFARALAALAFIFALGLVFNADGAFLKWGTHRDMLRHISVYAILASGMTVVIIAGGIDLSVGSVLGFNAVLFSLLSMRYALSPWLAIPACMCAGAACGLVSGFLTARFRMQAFIATLAMMVFARGLAKWISGGQKISTAVQRADGSYEYVKIPEIFDALSARILGGNIAVVTFVLLACLALIGLVLAKSKWGRYFYAVGGNEEAARLSGVPVAGVKMLAYGLCGCMAAIAGICQAAQEQQGDPEAGAGYELTAIAIAVIGGNSLMGGRGGAGLTLVGALTIGYLEKILSINAVGEAMRLLLTGLIIVIAVVFQRGGRR